MHRRDNELALLAAKHGVRFEALRTLADEAGLEVRPVPGVSADGAPIASGVCRLRDRVWVLLSDADPIEQRIQVLAGALRSQAGERLESRYLPPAVRDRLETP